VAAVVWLGLTALVFVTYFVLGIVRYRVSADGTVRVPWPYAWLVVLGTVLGVATVAYIVLRSLPEPWR
jgi:hypothetical protein